jgi:3'-phosphoadenosine 5'-phosphosulfate sulfotransferase (PAPS reductase)/FAD synthetase
MPTSAHNALASAAGLASPSIGDGDSRQLAAIDRGREQIATGALFVANHSGGKDSQAMLIRLLEIVPREQLLVVHASLGEVEWEGALELARDQAAAARVAFVVARSRRSLLQMVEERFAMRPGVPSWPSSATRQCTSDLKRGPCQREVRRYAKRHGFRFVVNCMGLRAEESSARAKRPTWDRSASQSVAGRAWFEWLPIHALTTAEVFATIAGAGQTPHAAYAAGNERLSCVFCILGSANDARVGAIHRPELYARYVELEQRTGYTVHQSRKSLPVLTGLTVEQARVEHARIRKVA